jgi:hypothetical protein
MWPKTYRYACTRGADAKVRERLRASSPRGLKIGYRLVWNFAHAETPSFKKTSPPLKPNSGPHARMYEEEIPACERPGKATEELAMLLRHSGSQSLCKLDLFCGFGVYRWL